MTKHFVFIILTISAIGCGNNPVPVRESAEHETELGSTSVSIADSVNPSTSFKLFRRTENGQWDAGTSNAYPEATKIVETLEGSVIWNGKKHGASYSMQPFHTQPPGIEIGLDWSNGNKDSSKAVWICYGNRLFWWKDSIFEIPQEKWASLDAIFPANK